MTPVSHIAVINDAGATDVELMVEAIRQELPKFCAAWSLPLPGIASYGRSAVGKPTDAAALFIVDSTGDESAFARHSALGVAIWSYVDVAVCAKFGEPISRAASHEIWEMIADPTLDRWIALPDGSSVAVEVCDPLNRTSYAVQAEFFGQRAAIEINDWVLPAWYTPGSAGPWTHTGIQLPPLVDILGGYHQERNGSVVTLSGSDVQLKSFGRSARRMAAVAAPF